MRQFRYSTSGQWFKGNTHIHSVASDGGKTFQELAELYASAGYDFLFRTDHWAASDTGQDTDEYPLLWLDGIELDGKDSTGSYFHIVCLGKVDNISRADGLEPAMESARAQGALLIAAHPLWSGNSLEDCLRHPFDGIEVYNHVCHWLNGKSSGLAHWNAALARNPGILGFAVDDAHLRPEHPGWNGGWIRVNAGSGTRSEILGAIRKGNFYSSCGPQILSMDLQGNQLNLATSPIRYMRLVGPGPNGNRAGTVSGPLMTQVSINVPESWPYAYAEIEDAEGRIARTNNLFVH